MHVLMAGLCRVCLVGGFFLAGLSGAWAEEGCGYDCRIARAAAFQKQAMAPLLRGVPAMGQLGGSFADVHWYDAGEALWFVRRMPDTVSLFTMRVDARRPERLVDARALIERMREPSRIDVGSLGPESLSYDPAARQVSLQVGAERFVFDAGSWELVQTDAASGSREAPPVARSPDGRFQLYTRDHDLFVTSSDGSTRRLSDDGELWYSFSGRYARSNPMHYPELAERPPRVTWIGNGPYFLIERRDHRHVGDVWMVDPLTDRPTLQQQKMAYPGEASVPKTELWVFNAESGHGHVIRGGGWDYVGSMDHGAGGAFPSRDGQWLYVTRIMRDYSRIALSKIRVATGDTIDILEETGGPQPHGGKPFFGVRWPGFVELSDGFLWKSDRDGFPHFYRYDGNGELLRQITKGPFAAAEILHVDEESDSVVFSAFGDGSGTPYQMKLFAAALSRTSVRPLDADNLTHHAQFSPDGEHFVDTVSSVSGAPELHLRSRDGRRLAVLAEADTGPLMRSGWRPPAEFRVLAADGKTPLYGVMWTPFDMREGEKYPIIVRVYPGPSWEIVPSAFAADHANTALAQLGFVVVTLGQRGGSDMRGRDYHLHSRGADRLRDYPIADNKAAILQLAERFDFIDGESVGIVGRSGGGFMAATAMLLEPDFYKVGVSIAGNHDNNIYEMNSSEYHFGVPGPRPYPTNADLAARLTGKLLIVHGDLDDDVTVSHSLRLVRALQQAGKKFDFMLLPGQRHRYSPEIARYLERLTWDYFLTNLAGVRASGVDLVK